MDNNYPLDGSYLTAGYIRSLRAEAVALGDTTFAQFCDRALAGDRRANTLVAQAAWELGR